MSPTNDDGGAPIAGRGRSGLRLNKNIYSHTEVLLWPAYTLVTGRLLRRAEALGIRLGDDDFETEEQTAVRLADNAYDELNGLMSGIRSNGRIPLPELKSSVIPMLRETLSARHLIPFMNRLWDKDDDTCLHSLSVGAIALQLGRWAGIPEADHADLLTAALLHDIGKLAIPSRILKKPGKLSPGEYEVMKKHTVSGYRIIMETAGMPERCALPALQHHERMDGSGYPFGLTGKLSNPFSRIIAIADTFHAMSSRRVYKEKQPFHMVIVEMYHYAFDLYDPEYTLLFVTKIMELLVGAEVELTNGERATVISLNPGDPLHPLVKSRTGFIDLSVSLAIDIHSF